MSKVLYSVSFLIIPNLMSFTKISVRSQNHDERMPARFRDAVCIIYKRAITNVIRSP